MRRADGAEAEREVGKQGRRIADLERQVELLEQEKAGLEQRNRDLLRKPFGTRSDRFVGWNPATRERNLARVVNHARSLILPWIRVPHLAAHLLARSERQLPADWHSRYGIRPVLLETFCETPCWEPQYSGGGFSDYSGGRRGCFPGLFVICGRGEAVRLAKVLAGVSWGCVVEQRA